jgi:multiple sugar transport system substrate-binding protein
VAVALNPTHLLLTTLTVCHALAPTSPAHDDLTPSWWDAREGPDAEVLTAAIDLVARLVPVLDPRSLDWDPIQLLDTMCATDQIDYTPAVFGYCSYARRQDVTHPVTFGDVPGAAGERRGGMLGGVGLAVSARCQNTVEVAAFLDLVAGGEFQAGGYAQAGGQPAHRAAWLSEQVNQWTPGFFAPTLASLDEAFVRPRGAHYPRYQHAAGQLLHQRLVDGTPAADVATALRELWQTQGASRTR